MRLGIKTAMVIMVLTFFCGSPAIAYVGPGVGITMLGSVWALLAGLVVVIGGILLWPMRALIRRKRRERRTQTEALTNES